MATQGGHDYNPTHQPQSLSPTDLHCTHVVTTAVLLLPLDHTFKLHAGASTAMHATVGLIFHWPGSKTFQSHSFCPPATPIAANPKDADPQGELDRPVSTGKGGKTAPGSAKDAKAGKEAKGP